MPLVFVDQQNNSNQFSNMNLTVVSAAELTKTESFWRLNQHTLLHCMSFCQIKVINCGFLLNLMVDCSFVNPYFITSCLCYFDKFQYIFIKCIL